MKMRFIVWLVLCINLVTESIAGEASDIPVTKGATNITDSGFTANWEPVTDATLYGVYAILTHTALSEETYYIVNEQFDLVDRGTEEEPYPGYEDFEYLDNYMNRTDWTLFMPMYIRGQIGLDNRFNEFLPAELKSPLYDLSHDNGNVSVALKAMVVEDADSITMVLCDKKGVTLDSIASKLNKEWTEMRFELHGGIKECYLRVNVIGSGIMYLDNLRLAQHLQASECVDVLYTYALTDQTSYDFLTLDKLKGDAYSYKVSAFIERGEVNAWSDYSAPERVITSSNVMTIGDEDKAKVYMAEDLHVVLSKAANVNIYSANGVCLCSRFMGAGEHTIRLSEQGLYCIKINEQIFKVIR